MTHLALLAGILALAASSAFDGPSLTAALLGPDSRTTELSGGSCRPDPAGTEAGLRCPGLGGASVLVAPSPAGAALALSWSAKGWGEPVVAGIDPDAAIEWRGVPTSKGFEPHAAIVPLDGEEPSAAVIRVKAGEACLLAVVTGRDVDAAARRVADERARSFRCGPDRGPDGAAALAAGES